MQTNREKIAMLVELIKEIEGEDCLDFGNMPVAESEVRELISASVLELSSDLYREMDNEAEYQTMLLAIIGHLLTENFIHQYRLIVSGQMESATGLVESIMSKLTKGKE